MACRTGSKSRATATPHRKGRSEPGRQHLAEDFTFSAPPDVGIDRATYFERCWPNHEMIAGFEFERLFENGDEVIVTYEATRTDGTRFRNTEILGFDGDKVGRVEVYFGWDVE